MNKLKSFEFSTGRVGRSYFHGIGKAVLFLTRRDIMARERSDQAMISLQVKTYVFLMCEYNIFSISLFV